MADDIAQPASTFEQDLAALVQALVEGGAEPQEAVAVAGEVAKAAQPQGQQGPGYRMVAGGPLEVDIAPGRPASPPRAMVGAGAYGLPSMPPLPQNALAGPEMRSSLSPEVDTVMGALGLPTAVGKPLDLMYRIGSAGPRQVQTADRAIGEAVADPTLPNVTNAGVQTGLAAMRPSVALGSLGAGYAAALTDDLGLLSPSSAEAQTRLTRDQRREMEMERQRAEREADIARRGADAQAAREKLTAEAAQKRELEKQAETQKLEEYNRAVADSEKAFNSEMARNRRFSDTSVGKVYDATGGTAPFLMGLAGAKLSRLATGPGKTAMESAVKDYVAPLASGVVTGAITPNVPLVYNALYTEPDNPKKRAYEARVEAMPPTHPRRQEFADFAAGLPDTNPVRDAASQEFYDPEKIKERLLMGGLEGFGGALLGTDAVRAVGRGASALSRSLGLGGKPSTTLPAGAAIDGIPPGSIVSTQPNALLQASSRTAPGSVAENALAGPPLPTQRQLSAPSTSLDPKVVIRTKTKDGTVQHRAEDGKYTSNPRQRE